jgi:hypothetical protein
MNSRNANYGLKTTGNQSLENSCFSVFFRRTTPVKMGAQGRIKGGYSIHTPYIVCLLRKPLKSTQNTCKKGKNLLISCYARKKRLPRKIIRALSDK